MSKIASHNRPLAPDREGAYHTLAFSAMRAFRQVTLMTGRAALRNAG